MKILRAAGVAGVLMVSAASSLAQQATQDTPESLTELTESQAQQSEQRAAQAWGLSQQEYQRYQSVMEGPRGIWSPDLDPITALGIEAQSDEERARYAELLVRSERARVERELAFQRAYDDAWKRLYPGDMPVNAFTTNGGRDASQSVFGADTSRASSRVNVVIATEGCDQCDATVRRMLSTGSLMDIWVVDSNGDDGRIRTWAAKVGIPPERVRAGDVTLNHGGTLNVDAADLPRVAPRG